MGKNVLRMIGAGAAALLMSSGMALAGAGGDECCARADELERENNLLKAQLENSEQKKAPLVDIPGDLSANAAFATDYSFRGISQTDNGPALSAGLDWTHDTGFYLGTWLSNVDFSGGGPGASSPELEVDIYGGYAMEWSDILWDIGVMYYHYANINEGPGSAETDYVEIYGKAGHDFGPFDATLGVAISPDYTGETGFYAYPNLGLGAVMPGAEWLDMAVNVGYSFIDEEATLGIADYLDYGVSVGATIEDLVRIGVGYYGTNLDDDECFNPGAAFGVAGGNDRACDGRVIGSVSVAY